MTDQLSDRLAAELAVCEAATEGPWEFEPDRTTRDGVYPAYVFVEHMAGYPICDVTSTRIPTGDEDAEFIATARTARLAREWVDAAKRARQRPIPRHTEAAIIAEQWGVDGAVEVARRYKVSIRDVRELWRTANRDD